MASNRSVLLRLSSAGWIPSREGVAQVAAKRAAGPAWRYACQGRFGYPGRRCDLLVAVPPGAVRPRKRS